MTRSDISTGKSSAVLVSENAMVPYLSDLTTLERTDHSLMQVQVLECHARRISRFYCAAWTGSTFVDVFSVLGDSHFICVYHVDQLSTSTRSRHRVAFTLVSCFVLLHQHDL